MNFRQHAFSAAFIVIPSLIMVIWCILAFNPATYDFAVSDFYGAREYTVTEMGTALAFLLSSFLGAWVAFIYAKRGGHGLVAAAFAIFALLAFVTCMEEVQWMQPLLQYDIPDAIGATNSQKEMTLHNLEGPHGKAQLLYLVFCAGAVALVLPKFPPIPADMWQIFRADRALLVLVFWVFLTALAKIYLDVVGNPFAPQNPIRWTTELTELIIGAWCVGYILEKAVSASAETS